MHLRLLSVFALSTEAGSLAPGSFWSLRNWSWEPAIVLPLVIGLALYAIGGLHRRQAQLIWPRHLSFAFGWLTLFLSLDSPLHELGEQLFSAHMLQHELMILIAAPLMAAAHPGTTCLWAFSPQRRGTLGKLLRSIRHARLSRFLMLPAVAWLLHAVALWGWHLPLLYQESVRNDRVHALQHLSFFLSALLFWSALYGIGQSVQHYGVGVLYVFGTAMHCGALGALLTFSSVLWYPIYQQTTYRWHLTPIQDQQLGGLIMWVPSGLVFILIGLVLFARWLRESDRRLNHGQLHLLVHSAAKSKSGCP
jgi:putative membrane protein